MREILFRGKRKDNGEWEYGAYVKNGWTGKEKPYIIPSYATALYGFEIDPETVGQFTGLTDKNGKKIFEGDIVSGTALSRERTGVIVWIEELAGFGIRYAERDDPTAWQESSILKDIERHKYSEFCAKVVGNIYDNPELLGESHEHH